MKTNRTQATPYGAKKIHQEEPPTVRTMNDISKPYYAINESDDNDYIEQLLANKNGKEKKKYKSFY